MRFGKESFRKKNNGRFLIGYQLFGEYAQISLLKIGENQPFTFSMVAGKEEYQLPLCLYRLSEEKLWIMGRDAVEKRKLSEEGYIGNLLEAAYEGGDIRLGEETYNPRALLALYVKKSLSLLSLETSLRQVAAIMFVIDRPDTVKIRALREMTEYLQLTDVEIMFMGKEESFFWYNLHTDQSLWKGQVMLYEWEKEGLISYRLFINKNTTPLVTVVEKEEYPQGKALFHRSDEEKDDFFLDCCRRDFSERNVTAVYLIGDGFNGDWYRESLKFLCQNRRAFRGNNLYSKGACQGLLQKLDPDKLGETYVYLGEDKLSANVGMDLIRQGEKSYLAILNGGNSWYECKKQWEVILEETNQLVFRIMPLNGKLIREYTMTLWGLKEQAGALTRIRLKAEMLSENSLSVKAEDRGFGQFYPSSGRSWEETIELM
ncbi:MAG: hypothetical protein IJP31_08710 [Lachnospiraceae bacterium]|nr:hypothetical protein [Lachnospiraceae bacterium]